MRSRPGLVRFDKGSRISVRGGKMDRRGPSRGRKSFARRLATLGTMAMVALVALAACGEDKSPYSTLSPRSSVAEDIQGIYKLIFWLALVVFVGVQFAIVYTAVRYRRRREDEVRPPQIHGSKTLEIVWTIIPAVVLLIIFIPTVQKMYEQNDYAQDGDYVIEVYGKQWWWEVHYKEPQEVATVVTANEIRVPIGKKVQIKLFSNNVIHSFYVPQLAGKLDVVPGHENILAFQADNVGTYFGECAEFCGDSHAWMRFQVIVEPQDQFDTWVAAYNAGPAGEKNDDGTTKVNTNFAAFCMFCHNVNGTNAKIAATGLDETQPAAGQPGTTQTAGPNLSLFGCRPTIGAGIMANTPENLTAWLHDPAAIKEGAYMGISIGPGEGKTHLTDDQVNDLVNYLESLKPEGGCPVLPEGSENADVASSIGGS